MSFALPRESLRKSVGVVLFALGIAGFVSFALSFPYAPAGFCTLAMAGPPSITKFELLGASLETIEYTVDGVNVCGTPTWLVLEPPVALLSGVAVLLSDYR